MKSLKVAAFLLTAVASGLLGCKEEEKKKVNISASLRSTGVGNLGLTLQQAHSSQASLTAVSLLANSTIELEEFQLPIGRINLTYGENPGGGYTGTSPFFYSCSAADPDECLVDIVNTDLSDLLGTGDRGEVEFDSTQTYTGIAVELCPDGAGGEGNSFNAYIKGSALLGDTQYYTNAADGLSATGPAELVPVELPCQGVSTDLLEPITLEPEATLDVVLWVEPTASILVTDNAPAANSNCTSEVVGTPALCVGIPAIFGTIDTEDPTVERHFLDVSTLDQDGNPYADMLLTTIYNSSGTPFGAALQQIYTNVEAAKLMHAPQFSLDGITVDSGLLTIGYSDTDLVSGIPREGTGSALTISDLVEEEATFTSTRLD